jgi:hypothetical protein
MKKGRNVFVSTLFTHLIIAPKTGNASASGVPSASALPYGLGFLDCCFVIPAAAAGSLVHARRGKIGGGIGLFVAASRESRAAPGWELVDLCGPLIQTRIHFVVSPCVEARELMLRPTRSRVVTKIDIGCALRSRNLIKTKPFPV